MRTYYKIQKTLFGEWSDWQDYYLDLDSALEAVKDEICQVDENIRIIRYTEQVVYKHEVAK